MFFARIQLGYYVGLFCFCLGYVIILDSAWASESLFMQIGKYQDLISIYKRNFYQLQEILGSLIGLLG